MNEVIDFINSICQIIAAEIRDAEVDFAFEQMQEELYARDMELWASSFPEEDSWATW